MRNVAADSWHGWWMPHPTPQVHATCQALNSWSTSNVSRRRVVTNSRITETSSHVSGVELLVNQPHISESEQLDLTRRWSHPVQQDGPPHRTIFEAQKHIIQRAALLETKESYVNVLPTDVCLSNTHTCQLYVVYVNHCCVCMSQTNNIYIHVLSWEVFAVSTVNHKLEVNKNDALPYCRTNNFQHNIPVNSANAPKTWNIPSYKAGGTHQTSRHRVQCEAEDDLKRRHCSWSVCKLVLLPDGILFAF